MSEACELLSVAAISYPLTLRVMAGYLRSGNFHSKDAETFASKFEESAAFIIELQKQNLEIAAELLDHKFSTPMMNDNDRIEKLNIEAAKLGYIAFSRDKFQNILVTASFEKDKFNDSVTDMISQTKASIVEKILDVMSMRELWKINTNVTDADVNVSFSFTVLEPEKTYA